MNPEQLALAAALPGHVVKGLRDGDRVLVVYGGLQARGTLLPVGLHWHTIKGRHTYLVELDGTGQQVEIDEQYLTAGPRPA